MIEQSQNVKLFDDSEKQGEQFVSYDPQDNWICITHDGETISMSVENWLKLMELSKKVLKFEKS